MINIYDELFPVLGAPGYKLSKKGILIRELPQHVDIGNGETRTVERQYVISPTPIEPDPNIEYPYWNIEIHGDWHRYSCHILMAEMFITKPIGVDHLVVNHKNGNKYDYSLDNLEWVTQSQNIRHAMYHGLCSNCTERSVVEKICEMIDYGIDNTEIARQFGLHHSTVCAIRNGRRHRQISGKYNFGSEWADEAMKD